MTTEILRHKQTPHLHAAVVHNGIIYASGHAASDIDQDIRGQTRETCAKLDKLLADLGSDKTKILQARIYLSNMADKAAMTEEWVNWIGAEHLPARATIGINDLGDPRRLIEIVITAAQ